MIKPSTLVQGTIDLISLPDIFLQVREMIDDPRYSAVHIGEVIAKDPALTARLLKIVNSSFYGFQGRIDTLTRAITIVGIDDLHYLVLATTAFDSFNRIPNSLVDMTDFWIRNVQCGVTARLIAKQSAVLHCERLFIAGLLHDLGSIIMYNKMPDESGKVLTLANGDRRKIGALEQDIFGFTHADVGAELMQVWGLPESLQEAIGFQLDPERAPRFRLEAQILFMANRLTDIIIECYSIQETLDAIPDRMYELTGLNEGQIVDIITKVPDEMADVFSFILPGCRSIN